MWNRIYGAPAVIISDHEGALCSEEGAVWSERWGTALRLKPRGSHAALVERHHAFLREQVLKLLTAARQEQLTVSFKDSLAEALFAKSAFLNVAGYTPYQALFGRHSTLLAAMEAAGQSALDDGSGGILSASRHAVRLRELARSAILESVAKDRMKQGAASKSRLAGELLGLECGEMVDLYRSPATKDLTGWRGSAEVVNVRGLSEGYVDVKWGGRVMSVRLPDRRRSAMFVFLVDQAEPAMEEIRQFLSWFVCHGLRFQRAWLDIDP